jgi:hypothetical protein
MKDTSAGHGQIKKPPEAPYKKRRLGSTQITPGTHAGRKGLMGAPKESMGYVHNGKHKQSPSG